jgi:DNA (cytosine-5)-methyltransferase 1
VSKSRHTVVSIFSGAMGLDIGLEATGAFGILACVEKEPVFCETIRLNQSTGQLRGTPRIYEGDICTINPSRVLEDIGLVPGELDVLIGGPPCQSFSTVGNRGTVNDRRGSLLWQFLRYVDAMRPKFFLMENVRGLLSAAIRHRPIAERPEHGGPPLEPDEAPGSVVRAFASALQAIDSRYHMDCFEVNAVNYGAPQLRERALFIGNRMGIEVDFPDPTHGKPEQCGHPRQGGLFREKPSGALLPWRTLRDAIGELREKDPVVMDFSPRKKSFLALVPPGSNWRSLPREVQQESMGRAWSAKGGRSGWWRRLSWDLPCPTLVTMPNHASTSLCHPSELRALSVREFLRIQEFPDRWELAGSPAEQYAQAGNAVPVRLGRVAGELIARHIEAATGHCAARQLDGAGAAKPYRVIYVQSHIRTRQWYRNGKTIVWEDGGDNESARYTSPKTKRKAKVMIAPEGGR